MSVSNYSACEVYSYNKLTSNLDSLCNCIGKRQGSVEEQLVLYHRFGIGLPSHWPACQIHLLRHVMMPPQSRLLLVHSHHHSRGVGLSYQLCFVPFREKLSVRVLRVDVFSRIFTSSFFIERMSFTLPTHVNGDLRISISWIAKTYSHTISFV